MSAKPSRPDHADLNKGHSKGHEAEHKGPPPPEIRHVTQRRISCDGQGGALGHPRIWLEIDARNYIDCPYCDRRYILDTGEDAS